MTVETEKELDVKKEVSEEPSAEENKKTVDSGTPAQEIPGEEKPKEETPGEETPPVPKKESRRNRKIQELVKANKNAEAENIRLRELNSKLTEDKLPIKPKSEDFTTDEEFEKANSEYNDKRQDHKIEKAVSKGRIEDTETVIKNSKDEILKEFDSEMKTLAPKRPEDFVSAIDAVSKQTFHKGVADYLTESSIGPDLAYELAKKPEILESMLDMTASQAIREMVKTEEAVMKSLETQKITKATDPIKPIDSPGGPMSEDKMEQFNSGKMDDGEWAKMRDEDIKKKQAQGMNVR